MEQLGYGKADNFGVEGELFYCEPDSDSDFPDKLCPSIIDYNEPPVTQPGLWLQWIPTADNRHIVWDKNSYFYHAEEWLHHNIERILAPRGYILNGAVNAQGQKENDQWSLQVNDNHVVKKVGFCETVGTPDFDKWEEVRINNLIKHLGGRDNLPAEIRGLI